MKAPDVLARKVLGVPRCLDGDDCLQADEVHVWLVLLDFPALQLCSAGEVLAADELQRADRFRRAQDRERYLRSRAVLRELLSGYTSTSARAIRFEYGPFGKPSISGLGGAHSPMRPICFNQSHCGDVLVVAIASEMAVGVDVEQARQELEVAGLAELTLSSDELLFFRTLEPAVQREQLLQIWVEKEAVLKASGRGFSLDPRAVSVMTAERSQSGVRAAIGGSNHDVGEWYVRPLRLLDGYHAAVATDCPDWTTKVFHFGCGDSRTQAEPGPRALEARSSLGVAPRLGDSVTGDAGSPPQRQVP